MQALIRIAILYGGLFLLYGIRNPKRFLLLTGIISLPFRTTYSFVYFGAHQGWTSGILMNISDISFLLLFAHAIIGRYSRTMPSRGVLLSVAAVLIAAAISLNNSTWPWMSVFMVIMVGKIAFLYYYVFVWSIATADDLRAVINFFTISLLFQSVIAILQFTTGQPHDYFTAVSTLEQFYELGGETVLRRVVGTIGKPNSLAAYIAPIIIMNIALLMTESGFRFVRIVSVALGLSALVMTFSRGGWTGFVIGLLFLVFVAFRRGFLGRKQAVALTLGGLVFAAVFSGFIEARLTGDDHDSAESRVPLMQIAFEMIREHPISGVGVNTARTVAKKYAIRLGLHGIYLQQVHNQYLLVFSEMGIIGLISFLLFLLACFREGKRCMAAPYLKYPYLAGLGIISGFVSAAVHMMVDLYNSHLLLANFFLLTGILTATARFVREDLSEESSIRIPLISSVGTPVFQELQASGGISESRNMAL